MSILLHKKLFILPSFQKKKKKIGALHPKTFSKHTLFTTFSLFLTVNEVYNISNKYCSPNKLPKKIFLRKTPYTAPSFTKILFSPSHKF